MKYLRRLMIAAILLMGFILTTPVEAKETMYREPLMIDVVQTDDPTDVSGLVMGAVVALIGIVALVYYQVKGKHQK